MCLQDLVIKQNGQNQVKEDLLESMLGAIAFDAEWNKDKLENAIIFMLSVKH